MEEILSNFDQLIKDRYSSFIITQDTTENKDFCKRSQQKIELRSYQKFPGEYLKEFRGLLIDHGLGAGKTKTAVQTIKTLGRDTVVMTPASLHGNFSEELLKSLDGNPEAPNLYFLHYNAGNLVEQYKKIGKRTLFEKKQENKFDGKLIIIEESHIFFQNVISGKAQIAITIFQYLMEAKDIKILCLSGTPIAGDPFEVVPLFNLLRGYLKDPESGKIFTLFPTLREEFYRDFVSEEFNSIKNKEVFQDRITGLVSYYKGILDPEHFIVPKVSDTQIIECPMGGRQWSAYLASREREWDYERYAKYATQAFKESAYKRAERASAGTYKTNSAQGCNFAFPEVVEKKYESYISNYGKVKEISEFKWELLLKEFPGGGPFKYVYDNIADLSGKISYLLKTIQKETLEKVFIYTKFQIAGALILSKMLLEVGYEQVLETDLDKSGNFFSADSLSKKLRFVVVDGTVKDPYKLIRFYNRPDNLFGEYCKILIGTSVVQAGVTLLDVQVGYCLEGQWRLNILSQVKGRMIRTCSHERLPQEDRKVDFYVLLAVPPKPEMRAKLSLDDGRTTDEYLYSLALRKAELCSTFIDAMHEAAVDCYLNRAHNGTLDCRSCMNSIPIPIIPADYKVHLVNGSKCVLYSRKTNLVDYRDPETGEEYKKDDADNLYLFNQDLQKYEEVGFLKDGHIILNSDFV